jgi:hypothetical protein
VVHAARLSDAVALLELRVHVRHGLVPEARDFTDLEVAEICDFLSQLREVPVKARGEGSFEDVVGLGVVFCDLYGAPDVENLRVDDRAAGQCGAVVAVLVLDRRDRVGVDVCDDGLVVSVYSIEGLERLNVALLLEAVVTLHASVALHVHFLVGRLLLRKLLLLLDVRDGVRVHTGAGSARHC